MDFLLVIALLAIVFLTPVFLIARVVSRATQRSSERQLQALQRERE